MITRKNLFAILLAFCISSIMFAVLPIQSRTTSSYDPWADVSGPIVGQPDGVINMRDIAYEVSLFNTNGTPLNRTQMNNAIELEQLLEQIVQKNYTDWYNGLVGYWKFDEGNGSIAFDSSGNGNDGQLIGNVSRIDGKYGGALLLGGEGTYVLVNDSTSLDLTGVHPFTLMAWIRPDAPQGNTSLAVNIIDKYSNYALIYDHGVPDNRGVLFRSSYTWYSSGEVNISIGVWHNYVGVYDPPYLIAYLDGNKVAEREVGFLNLDNNTNNVVFGTNMELTSQYFGAIDEISIYNRSLSAEEVQFQYLLPPP